MISDGNESNYKDRTVGLEAQRDGPSYAYYKIIMSRKEECHREERRRHGKHTISSTSSRIIVKMDDDRLPGSNYHIPCRRRRNSRGVFFSPIPYLTKRFPSIAFIIAAFAVLRTFSENHTSDVLAFSLNQPAFQKQQLILRRTISSFSNEKQLIVSNNKSLQEAATTTGQCDKKNTIMRDTTSASSRLSSAYGGVFISSTTLFLAQSDDEGGGGGGGRENAQSTPTTTSSSDDSPSDESEWRALLASLSMYKAAYGDLKVPQKFVVPNMAPWPKPAWGLKLGRDVYAIRSTGKYISGQPKRRQQLDRLDFVWSVRRSSSNDSDEKGVVTLEQIILAASTYRRLNNDSTDSVAEIIPDNYVVPDSEPWPELVRTLPLGRQLKALQRNCPPTLREKLEDLKILPKAKGTATDDSNSAPHQVPSPPVEVAVEISASDNQALSGLDDKMSANDIRFQKVFLALKTYREIHGDLLVPQPFAVPGGKNSVWPEETWDLRLGARVNAIRSQGTFVNSNPERRQMLDDLGFVWTPPKEVGRRGRKPKGENGEMGDETDEMEEGDDSMNSDEGYEAIDSLFDGSFDFGQDFNAPDMYDKSSSSLSTSPSWDLEKARIPDVAMKAAAEQEAAMKDDEYLPPPTLAETLEEATQRAIEVGVISGRTPNKRVIKGKREKEIPWFNDDFGDYFVFDDVVEALTIYKSIYGGFSNITENFVVPTPKEVTGFLDENDGEFGDTNMFDNYDVAASSRAAAAIADFEKQGQTDRSEDLIAAEIKRLQKEDGNKVTTATETENSRSFASGTEKWVEHLAGMRLGSIVSRIRDGSLEVKHIPERKAQLDAIGFDWGDSKYFLDVAFEKAMCAMYAYYMIRGDMFVYADFVMPDEDPWPQVLAGYELGQAVKRLRQLQNFLEAYHPDKVSLLRMIDFVWFSDTVALPLDPNEREMTSETLLLSALGHPDYAKMIDIPMGLPDKIIADGPFIDTGDDPKLWWRKWHNWDYVKDYWYQQGRRDNAYVLRQMGYPQMADEHEAKYGPGLFKEIDEVMNILEDGIDDKSHDEKEDILEKLNYFRHEMVGCTDVLPLERDQLIANFDMQMVRILKGIKLEMSTEDEMESADYAYETYNGKEDNERESAANNIEDKDDSTEETYEGEEFDLEDELGFGKR